MKSSDDTDPASSDWDQDEKTVIIKVLLPEPATNNVLVKVTAEECSVVFKGKEIWHVELYREIDPDTKKITSENKEVTIHVEKKVKFEEWKRLERHPTDAVDKDEEDGTVLKECNIDHIKNDMFEKNQESLTLHLYLTNLVRDSVEIKFEPENLTVSFRTNDQTLHSLYENTSSKTTFIWTTNLKHPVLPEKCKYDIKKRIIDISFQKLNPGKWGSLSKPQSKTDPSRGEGDWVRFKSMGASSQEQYKGKNSSLGDQSAHQGLKENHGAKGGAKSVNMGENRSQKPTCAVPPLAHGQQPSSKDGSSQPVHPLGFTGLDNLGNTCFMNGVLQVLANTRELKDFMLDDNLRLEINQDNPLGTGGQLVLSFAVLMRFLWSGNYKSHAPSKFKTIIASKASQFMGFAQHDAQEFMAFLLDGLHEDLNRVKNKPYTTTVDSDGRPDEVIAEESWKTHRRRNDSFIVDLFQGQYKSKLVCPVCNKVSITFDPFMQLSVPLPRKKQQLPIYFWSKEVYRKPIRMKLYVTSDGDILELKQAVAERTGTEPENLRVFEVFKSRVHKFFDDRDTLSNINLNDIIFVYEVLSPKLAGENVFECVILQRKSYPSQPSRCSYCQAESHENKTLKRCTNCLRAAYCDQQCQKRHWNSHRLKCSTSLDLVGMPFMISLPASHTTYARLSQTMESIARYSTNIFQPPVSSSSTSSIGSTNASGEVPPPRKVEAGDMDEVDETDSKMSDAECSTEDVDAELAAEMIVKESPQPSSEDDDEEEVEQGAVGGESWRRNKKKNESCNETEAAKCQTTNEGIATASVIGQPQVPERRQPLFFIKPCHTLDGKPRAPYEDRLKDEGDTLLDLSKFPALTLDWRNNPKQVNHVLVETKALDFDEEASGSGTQSEKVTTLEQCLQLFTEAETLTPNEAWYCPKCKEHREASKQLSLWRLPSVLIIQLKRFSFKNFIWRDKIDKMVEFPLRGLDLSEFCQTQTVKGQLPVYDLYGVINHHGGILGGHYTAYARLNSKESLHQNELDWRLFDDSHVTRTTEDAVVTRSAYLLFYRQRKPYVAYIPRACPSEDPEELPELPEEGKTKRPSGKGAEAAEAWAGNRSESTEPLEMETEDDNRRQDKEDEESWDEEEEECGTSKREEVTYTNIDEID